VVNSHKGFLYYLWVHIQQFSFIIRIFISIISRIVTILLIQMKNCVPTNFKNKTNRELSLPYLNQHIPPPLKIFLEKNISILKHEL
jgi:hypothetical protein